MIKRNIRFENVYPSFFLKNYFIGYVIRIPDSQNTFKVDTLYKPATPNTNTGSGCIKTTVYYVWVQDRWI